MRGTPLLAAVALAAAGRAQDLPPAPVVVAPVEEREVAAGRAFVGAIEPVRRSTVGSEVDGLVVEYLVREGDPVAADQPLARLRTRLLEIRLEAARAQAELRRQELAEQENGSRPEEIEEAKARAESAEAAVELRAWRLESVRKLHASGTISEDELKEAQLAARQAEARLREVRASLRLIEAGPRAEKIAQARARLKAEEAAVARLEDELERHTIRAPFAGYVVAEHTEKGQWLSGGDPVAEIAALDQVEVNVPVVEDYVAGLAVGRDVAVSVDAIPGRTWPGRLAAIVPRADARARTFPVKIRLDNARAEDGTLLLKAGMFARIQLAVGRKRRALLVPKDAIVLGGPEGPVVYTVADGKAVAVPVRLGIAVDGHLQVLDSPLAKGQPVVVRGNERLRPGQAVRVTETR